MKNNIDEMVEVKNKKTSLKFPRLNEWIKVTRFCAAGLQGVEVREIQKK